MRRTVATVAGGAILALVLAGTAFAGEKTDECKNAPNGYAYGVGNGDGNAFGHHKCDAVGATEETVQVPVVTGTGFTPVIDSSTGTIGVRGSIAGTTFELIYTGGEGPASPVYEGLSQVVTEAVVLVRTATDTVGGFFEGTSISPSYTVDWNEDGLSASAYFGSVDGSDVGLDAGPIPLPRPGGPISDPLPEVVLSPSVNVSTQDDLYVSAQVGSVDGSEVGLDAGPIPLPRPGGPISDPIGDVLAVIGGITGGQ